MRGGRGGGCCCCLKKQKKVARCSHRKTLGLEEAQGSRASHKRPHMSVTPSFKGPQIVSVQTRDNEMAHLYAHTPRGLKLFLLPPPHASIAFAHFLFPRTTFCFGLLALGKRWISFCHRRTSEGRLGH